MFHVIALYPQLSPFILSFLGILWGYVYAQYRTASRFTPSYAREAYVCGTVGRSLVKRVYDDLAYR